MQLAYMPHMGNKPQTEEDLLYLHVSKKLKSNRLHQILTLYLQTINIEFTIKPIMNELYFSQFFFNRIAPTPGCPQVISEQQQPPPPETRTEAHREMDIIQLLEEKSPVMPSNVQRAIITKEQIIQEINQSAAKRRLPLPIDDTNYDGPEQCEPRQKRMRLHCDATTSVESVSSGDERGAYSEEEDDEDGESSTDSDDEKATPSEINLNKYFSSAMQTQECSEQSFVSIGSSILRRFKSMHINSNKYAQPLLLHVNNMNIGQSSDGISRQALQQLFNEFISEFPLRSASDTTSADCLASIECIEQSRIQLVEKMRADNNFLQHLFLQVKNGCVESIYQLFIILLYTDLLTS